MLVEYDVLARDHQDVNVGFSFINKFFFSVATSVILS